MSNNLNEQHSLQTPPIKVSPFVSSFTLIGHNQRAEIVRISFNYSIHSTIPSAKKGQPDAMPALESGAAQEPHWLVICLEQGFKQMSLPLQTRG
jgi:hypothetical protein